MSSSMIAALIRPTTRVMSSDLAWQLLRPSLSVYLFGFSVNRLACRRASFIAGFSSFSQETMAHVSIYPSLGRSDGILRSLSPLPTLYLDSLLAISPRPLVASLTTASVSEIVYSAIPEKRRLFRVLDSWILATSSSSRGQASSHRALTYGFLAKLAMLRMSSSLPDSGVSESGSGSGVLLNRKRLTSLDRR